jgi:sigma-E factor negative regulatory protein RseA
MAINNQLSEQLSALADGELDELELRRLLKQLGQLTDPEREHAYQLWQRYQLLSESLQGERGSALASPSFYLQVQKALSGEAINDIAETLESGSTKDAAQLTATASAPVWSRFAVAASVALAVIVGVQQYQINGQNGVAVNTDGQVVAVANGVREVPVNYQSNGSSVSAAQHASLKSDAELSVSPLEAAQAQQRLNEYLLEHASSAASQSGQGMVPYARVANFETD